MSGHTPGPWLLSERTVYALNLEGTNRFSARVDGGWATSGRMRTDESELLANARLIAVAPDLLDLANDIVSNVILAGTEIGQRAQELIAKATGATP